MNSHKRKNLHLFLGILSNRPWFAFSNSGSDFGDHRIGLGFFIPKESGLDYKTEKILNIVGLVISVLNWIAAIALVFR